MIDSPVRPSTHAAAALREGYRAARAAGAQRHRDIAQTLEVSEGELIAAHATTTPSTNAATLHAQRLAPPWPAVVAALPTLGPVMALTRNASCVHEKEGRYESVSGEGPVGLVLGPDIDLRIFYSRWAHGFAVTEHFADSSKPAQHSLQFFDASGVAVHKVFARAGTDLVAWQALIERFADASGKPPGITVQATTPPAPDKPDSDIDGAAFHADWAGLRDTHEFFGLLKRHGLSRVQALRLAEPRFVQPVDSSAARDMLEAAAAAATPIMVFVGNPGMIQIHSGAVKRVQVLGPWLNVLDPGFNLHLREDHIASAWVVRKPTADGIVTSLELFDAAGETIAMFFGERKPGRPELAAWRRITGGLVGAAGDGIWLEEGTCASC
jgi:putative hemin transport protein